jgi:hypothetical protein
MRKISAVFVFFCAFIVSLAVSSTLLLAKTTSSLTPTPSPIEQPNPSPKPDLTQKIKETLAPLEGLLAKQKLGPVWPSNPIKYAIRLAVASGVPVNTVVLLLLLPVVATVIAASRHLIGLRGFGIFLPATLSVVFVATGPIIGIGLFLLIVFISTIIRVLLRKLKIKLQYLPRMAFLLWAVSFSVLGILFLTPVIRYPGLTNVSIFPVLFLALLAEDFTRAQLGKSVKTAINLTTETLILALVSFVFLTLKQIQEFALLNPEALLLATLIVDYLLGKYVGLRLMEFWRFRKLVNT